MVGDGDYVTSSCGSRDGRLPKSARPRVTPRKASIAFVAALSGHDEEESHIEEHAVEECGLS